MQLIDLKAANLVVQKPQVDDLLLCGSCSTINIVTILGTRMMTEKEFDALHPDEKKDLNFAQRAVKRQLRSN